MKTEIQEKVNFSLISVISTTNWLPVVFSFLGMNSKYFSFLAWNFSFFASETSQACTRSFAGSKNAISIWCWSCQICMTVRGEREREWARGGRRGERERERERERAERAERGLASRDSWSVLSLFFFLLQANREPSFEAFSGDGQTLRRKKK